MSDVLTVAELDERINASSARKEADNAQTREETYALQMLLERKQRLITRLEAALSELQNEQVAINAEVRRLLTPEEQLLVIGTAKP